MKVIIIGAGIGGLTAGIALSNQGIEVTIYERESQLAPVGAGLTLWNNALNALDKIGLGDAVREYGVSGSESGIHNQLGHDIVAMSNDSIEQHPINYVVIHRAKLQLLLLNAFSGEINYSKQLSRYQQVEDAVRVHFADGSQDTGDILIGCDGIHSVVRQQMFPESNPIYAGYVAYRGVVDFEHEQVGKMWGESWGYGHRFGITPLQNNQIYWFATANQKDVKFVQNNNHKVVLQDIFADWHQPIPELIEATPPDRILRHAIYAINPLKSWRDNRVILLGDAAHAMTPNLGQGACQAIEDGVVLDKLFGAYDDYEKILQCYEDVRIPRANAILRQSQQVGMIGQIDNRVLCQLRNLAFRWTPPSIRMKTLNNIINFQIESL